MSNPEPTFYVCYEHPEVERIPAAWVRSGAKTLSAAMAEANALERVEGEGLLLVGMVDPDDDHSIIVPVQVRYCGVNAEGLPHRWQPLITSGRVVRDPTSEERERLNEAVRRYRESLKRFVWQAGDVTVCDPTPEERISEEERQLLLERMRRARERQDRMEREWNEAEREARQAARDRFTNGGPRE